MIVSGPPRVHYSFEAKVDALQDEAARLEAVAHAQIADAEADWKRWSAGYRAARGVDGAGCRWALTQIENCRARIRWARELLYRASKRVEEAVRVEHAGRQEWGLE